LSGRRARSNAERTAGVIGVAVGVGGESGKVEDDTGGASHAVEVGPELMWLRHRSLPVGIPW
jgi:hypothetical protein